MNQESEPKETRRNFLKKAAGLTAAGVATALAMEIWNRIDPIIPPDQYKTRVPSSPIPLRPGPDYGPKTPTPLNSPTPKK